MADEPQVHPQEEVQGQIEENSLILKDEIKRELKEELRNLHQKRKRRVIYSVCIFALGVLIGFGGGSAVHHGHHNDHGHFQNEHHFRE